MKTSIRKLVRQQGWHLCELTNVDYEKYIQMRNWCDYTFSKNAWLGKSHGYQNVHKVTCKKFAFRQERDKLMFMLKWN
jgi:hypothetical protein